MAQVPYSGVPEVSVAATPTPQVHNDVPLAAFGGATAAATSNLGKAVEGAGNEIWARAMAMQQLQQQTDAVNAVSDYIEKSSKRFAEYQTLEGKAAVDGFQPYLDDIKKIREETGNGLSSPYAQRIYLQESRAAEARSMFSAAKHSADQQKKYVVGTSEGRIASAINATGLDPTNQQTYDAAIKAANDEADHIAIAKSLSKDQRDDFVLSKTSDAVYTRAKALSERQPAAAKAFLDDALSKKLISSEQYGAASKYVRSQIITVGARVEASNIMSGESQAFGTGKVNVANIAAAIRQGESSNNYQLDKTFTRKLDDGTTKSVRVLGAYSITEPNLAPWLKEAGMPPMTADEFKNDPKAQDKLAAFKINQYQEQYGNANEVAKSWRGRGGTDPYIGETEAQYLTKFNRNLRKVADGAMVEKVTLDQAQKLFPNDPEAQEALVNRTATMHQKDRTQDRETQFNNRQKIDDALLPAPDGKLVTSIEDLPIDVQEIYNNALPQEKTRVQKRLERNAQQDYAATDENQRDYRMWIGRMTDPTKTMDETNAILDHDFMSDTMPAGQRKELMMMQRKVFSGTLNSPQMTHALQVLKPMMVTSGIDPKNKEDYAVFVGSLHMLMDQQMKDKGGMKLDDKQIQDIGAGLIRSQSTKFMGIFPTKTPTYQMDVPSAEREKIVDAFSKIRNREPTEVEIRAAYNARQYNMLQKKPGAESKPDVPRSQ